MQTKKVEVKKHVKKKNWPHQVILLTGNFHLFLKIIFIENVSYDCISNTYKLEIKFNQKR